MKIRNIIIAGMAMLGLAACSDEDFLYQDQARVRLVGPSNYTAGTDSLTFSFVTYPSDTTTKVMNVQVYVMGNVADRDRTANITVDNDLTTASAAQYDVPSTVTVPAGKAYGILPVTLRRTADIQDRDVRLYIKVAESADFGVGVNEENHLTLIWNDKITKPSNWDDLEEYFGSYSDTKYRFMIENAGGLAEFDADTMSWAELHSYKIRFVNALNNYNNAHPGSPLTDENGVLVTFE